jgi:CBS-domain-containing membrane protein
VFETFKLLDSKGLTGTAVVGDHGEILTSTSGKDLKLWLVSSQKSGFMKLSIFEFLKTIRNRDLAETALVITVRTSDNLGIALGKLSATHSHRVFVVDVHNHPVRVISLTDILRWVTSH